MAKARLADLTIERFDTSFYKVHIAYALLFGLLYRQQPLFVGNQNTKFLHAAAQAEYGFLKDDWTAHTVDPLPVFTVLIRPVFEALPLATFYAMFAVLAAVLAYSAAGLAGRLHLQASGRTISPELALIFATLFVTLACLIDSMVRGVAAQYIFTTYLQPCVFGVFILLALLLWLEEHPYWAALSLAVAAIFHPGAYLLTSIIVLTALIGSSWRELSNKTVAISISIFLGLVGPIMAYQAMSLAPTTPEAFTQATELLANGRIPHHTIVARWFDTSAALKFAWMAVACVFVRRQPQLFWTLAALTAFGLLSSIALYIWPNAGARFSTPWRVTAVSMPLATIIMTYYCSAWIVEFAQRQAVPPDRQRWATGAVFACLSAVLIYKTVDEYIHDSSPFHSDGAMQYARSVAGPGQHYLVPTGIYDFRFGTGLPVLVTSKTHPYKDVEVLEWKKRVAAAATIYRGAANPGGPDDAGQLLSSYGITHVLVPAGSAFEIADYAEVYKDEHYKIFARGHSTQER